MKSANRSYKDYIRLTAFRQHKNLVSELPFANVKSDELPNLMPKPTSHNAHPRTMNIAPIDFAEPSISESNVLAELEQLKVEKQALRAQFDEIQKYLNEKVAEIDSLQSKLVGAEKENIELKTNLYIFQEKCRELTSKNVEYQQELKQKQFKSNSETRSEFMIFPRETPETNQTAGLSVPKSENTVPHIEQLLTRQAESWYNYQSNLEPDLPDLSIALIRQMIKNLNRCQNQLQIIRYQVDKDPFVWQELQYRPGMPLHEVNKIVQRKMNIRLEQIAAFFMFNGQMFASLDSMADLDKFPIDNINDENGRILRLYILTKGNLMKNGNCVLKVKH